jgi:hypothetical protein
MRKLSSTLGKRKQGGYLISRKERKKEAKMLIRRMELRDCDAVNTIYNYYISQTAITFDLVP